MNHWDHASPGAGAAIDHNPAVNEREAWDRRYAEGGYVPRSHPTPLLERWIDSFPPGRALDIACGTGRNALYLAERGYQVEAVDISQVAIEQAAAEALRRGLDIAWQVADLNEFDVTVGAYQVITVVRYRNPALWPQVGAGLADDGWLVVEHHMKSPLDVAGPRDPAFRLDPQELLEAFGALRIVHYTEAREPADLDPGEYVIARLVACNGDPGL